MKKILAVTLSAILVVNIILLALDMISVLYFWLVIGIAGVAAYGMRKL